MASSAQYAGFGDTGKQLKDTAFASAVATLVLPLATLATMIIMSFAASRGYYYYGTDYEAAAAYTDGCLIAAYCIIGGLILLFYLAILNYKIRTFKSLKNLGEQHGNADISALAKHWFVELILMVATAPLFAVSGIAILVNNFVSYSSNAPWRPVLLLVNWFAMALSGMYSVIDGYKKWQPVGQMLTSYKGRAGMQFLTTSQGVGLAILIISHYAMIYLLEAIAGYSTCSGSYSGSGYCSILSTMFGFLFPVGAVCGILTLITTVNQIKGLFRVGNAFIDLEEGRVSAAPGSSYYRRQAAAYPYSTASPYNNQNNYPPSNYNAPATGGGYQSAWNQPHYSQALQPMQPVSPAPQSQPAYRDTSAIEASAPATARGTGRCKSCHAALPPEEDVQFCPYCGAVQ